jgi:uncharacterized protein (TIGR03435 family)
MIRQDLLVVSAIAALPIAAFGQQAVPEFDVVSVKSSQAFMPGVPLKEGMRKPSVVTSPGTVTMMNTNFAGCVAWAYNLQPYQVSGPAKIAQERYDIVAKAGAPVPVEQLRLMMQKLLADRFKLTFHRETREMPVYVLTVVKGGPKFQPSASPGEADFGKGDRNKMTVSASHMTMAKFAEILQDPLRTPVIDNTGLDGQYDFSLDLFSYVGSDDKGRPTEPSEAEIPGIIMSAVQRQLGLHLESKKTPTEFIVLEGAEKPAEN